jgi:hypothetical protein
MRKIMTLFLRAMATSAWIAEFQMTSETANQCSPAIRGDLVIWVKDKDSKKDNAAIRPPLTLSPPHPPMSPPTSIPSCFCDSLTNNGSDYIHIVYVQEIG